jgi:ribosomal protein S18 acetylase RimI-like enzyme
MSQAVIVEVDWSNEKHGNDLVGMLNEYALDPSGGGQALSQFTQKHLFHALAERKNCHAVLLYKENEAVGLLISFVGFSTFACRPLLNLHDIVVSRSHRGLGYSKQLLQAAESIANRLGCCKLTLEVLSKNEVAIRAYESFGFENYQLDSTFGQAMFLQKKLMT